MNVFTTPAARRAIAGTATVLAAVTGMGILLAGTASADDTASVTGRIWFDRDADGAQDAAEPGYERGGVISLSRGDEFVGYYDTDVNGNYLVTDLAPGEYRVANMDNGVYWSTTDIYQDVSLSAGGLVTADFGMRGGSIRGESWFDADGDGVRDDDEAAPEGAAGAPAHLRGPAGLALDATLEQDGRYLFQDLPNGSNYEVTAPTLAGLAFVSQDSGHSQIDPATGTSAWLEIWQGTDHVVDVGYVATAADPAHGAVTVDPAERSDGDGAAFTMRGPAADTASTSDTETKAASEDLAYTGASPVVALVVGAALLAAGSGLVFFLRRRRALS